jgi:hypothetical protein
VLLDLYQLNDDTKSLISALEAKVTASDAALITAGSSLITAAFNKTIDVYEGKSS